MNKIYRVVWSAAHKSWVVTSELAKGKQKSSNSRKLKLAMPPRLKILSAILLISGFLHSSFVFAGTSCSVANLTEYAAALKNADCSDIVLTGNINLNNGQSELIFGSRDTVNIEGNNQYSITNPGSMKATGEDSTKQVNLNFKNLTLATKTAPNANNNVLLYVPHGASNINTTFDQISSIPNMTLAVKTSESFFKYWLFNTLIPVPLTLKVEPSARLKTTSPALYSPLLIIL